MKMKKLLNVDEVAELFSVPTSKVYYLVKTNELKAVKIGKAYRFNPDVIHSYMNGTAIADETEEEIVEEPEPEETVDQPDLGNVKKTETPVTTPKTYNNLSSYKEAEEPETVIVERKVITIRYLFEAAVLVALGHPMTEAFWQKGMNLVFFNFEHTQRLQDDLESHHNGSLLVGSKDMWHGWQTVKKLAEHYRPKT